MRPGVATAVATLLASLVLLGCGGGGKTSEPVAWVHPPRVLRAAALPRDRVAYGQVRNASGKSLTLDARRVRLLDARGRVIEVTTTARFLAGFAHGLYSPTQFGQVQNAFELRRLGVLVRLAPGQALPFNVAWRLRPGSAAPARVEVGSASLPLPREEK